MSSEAFSRVEAVLGETAVARLAAAHILVVGIGGVGSWCAEALARTGVGQLTVIDDDVVVESNLNRQCPATVPTLGQPKVEAMRARLAAVNPLCQVTTRCERFVGGLDLRAFDVIVDAIDSVDCKAQLILDATDAGVPIVSSLGAALRTDPTKVCVSRFDKVSGDGLARALRQRFKKRMRFPSAKFDCVWSTECPVASADVRARGSLMPVTATFGMCLASAVLKILTIK